MNCAFRLHNYSITHIFAKLLKWRKWKLIVVEQFYFHCFVGTMCAEEAKHTYTQNHSHKANLMSSDHMNIVNAKRTQHECLV